MSIKKDKCRTQAKFESNEVTLSNEDRFEIRKMCGYKTSSIHRMTERTSVPLWVNRRKRKEK